MYVEETGPSTAPAVLLLHGGGVAGWMWRAQVAHFAPRYRLLIPDLPGHNRSRTEPFTTSAAVVAELAELLRGQSETTVVGFSLGAQLALQLAVEHPDVVRRLVVVSALTGGVPLSGLSDLLVRLAAPLAQRIWFARLQAKSLFIPDEFLEDYLLTSRALPKESLVALTRANSAFRAPAAWSAFPGRSLLLYGTKEPRALRDGMQRLAASNPRAELIVRQGAGHGLPLQDPEWFNAELDRWLALESSL